MRNRSCGALVASVTMVLGTCVLAGPAGAATPPAPARSGQAAVDWLGARLPTVAERAGLSEATLRQTLRTDTTLRVDAADGLFYTEPPLPTAPAPVPASPTAGAVPGVASLDLAPNPYTETFRLHSNPGSPRTIYLDFTGGDVRDTSWNANGLTAATYPPFDTDGDPSSFSTAEQDLIQGVWQRVSEDYAPLGIDVTTEEPAGSRLARTEFEDEEYGAWVLITPSSNAERQICGSCGGVAYLSVFNRYDGQAPTGRGNAYYAPAWVFPQSLAYGEKYIAEAASHEAGHNLGLLHDGKTDGTTYYDGQGAWGAIMGNSYYRPLTQWSRGSYTGANNKQDDFAVMRSFGALTAPDPAGDSLEEATPLADGSSTVPGLIVSAADRDVFRLDRSCAGMIAARADPAPVSPNLDIRLRLLDAAGGELAASDPPVFGGKHHEVATGLNAGLAELLEPGTYYLEVDGVGYGDPMTNGYEDYGSLGAYTLAATTEECPEPTTYTVSATSPVDEGGTAVVTVTRSGGTDAAGRIGVRLDPDTAEPGADYTDTSGELAFEPGQVEATLDVPITDDGTPEVAEQFTATLVVPDGEDAVVGGAGSATIEITDDDPVPVFTVSASSPLAEEGGPAVVTVTRGANTSGTDSVTVTLTDDSAKAPGDYTDVSGDVTFTPGQQTRTLEVPITDDSVPEPTEQFQVALSVPAGQVGSVGDPGGAVVQITDSDPGVVFTVSAPSSVAEGDPADVVVTRSGYTGSATAVEVRLDDDSAKAPSDYTDVSGELSFAPGQTEATLSVPTAQDDAAEETEQFGVTLLVPDGVDATVGDPGTAVVQILDDDPKPVYTVAATEEVAEGGTAVVTVTRSGNLANADLVTVTLTDGTATAPADYSDVSGDLYFGQGQETATLEVPTTDDDIPEPTEQFTVDAVASAGRLHRP